MEERVYMVGSEVVTGPRRVLGSTEEETGRITPLELMKNLEQTGEPVARAEPRGSTPCNYNIHLFIPARLSGW